MRSRGPGQGGMMNVSADLERLFPGYLSAVREDEWRRVKDRVPAASRVKGAVVAVYHFGVFLDVKVGFPALLIATSILPAERDGLVVGKTMSARVIHHTNGEVRQTVLTQLDHDPPFEGFR